jgi:hypothetical protein
MRSFTPHIRTWWGALTNPGSAGRLVLGKDRQPGFIVFVIAGTIILYAAYGFSMGTFRGIVPGLVSAIKMPALYILSLCVCLPVFYLLNCLHGPRLELIHCLRLLVIAVSANAVAISSYTPLSMFFTLTTSKTGYPFMIIMHVAVLGVAGLISVFVIMLTFRATASLRGERIHPFFIVAWGTIYGLVGTQMAWVLRPMIGTWSSPYTAFRPVGGSFIERVWTLIVNVL